MVWNLNARRSVFLLAGRDHLLLLNYEWKHSVASWIILHTTWSHSSVPVWLCHFIILRSLTSNLLSNFLYSAINISTESSKHCYTQKTSTYIMQKLVAANPTRLSRKYCKDFNQQLYSQHSNIKWLLHVPFFCASLNHIYVYSINIAKMNKCWCIICTWQANGSIKQNPIYERYHFLWCGAVW